MIYPANYGFIPQTYCGDSVGELCMQRTRRKGIAGDGDPLGRRFITNQGPQQIVGVVRDIKARDLKAS